MNRFVICAAALAVSAPAVAAPVVSTPNAKAIAAVAARAGTFTTPDAVADALLGGVQSGQLEETFRNVFPLLVAQKPIEVQNLIAQLSLAQKNAGRIRGWEMMRERELSPSFVERYYLLKGDAPIFFRLLLYKVDGAWTVYSVGFNDQVDRMPGLLGLPSTP